MTSAPIVHWERKFTTHYYSLQDVTAGGWFTCLNDIPCGTDYDQRLGRKISSDYLDFTFTCRCPTTANYYDWLRVAIVIDRQSNATQLSPSDYYDLGVCSEDFMAPVNIKTWPGRFKVLREWRSNSLVCTTSGFFDGEPNCLHWRVKLPKSPGDVVAFGGTTATIPTRNAVYVVVTSHQNSATTSRNAQAAFCANYYFTDA